MIVILCFVFLSRSISVAIAAATFLPVVLLRRRNWISSVLPAGFGLLVGVIALGSRIREAVIDAQGGFLAFITVALNSWRNIPDILVLANYKAFLLPTHPADLRSKITIFAFELDPALSWIQNTYSTFAAAALTVGLIAVLCLFVSGVIIGIRCTSKRAALLLLYIYDWFLSPKYDAAGWIALGVLPLVWRMTREEIRISRSSSRRHADFCNSQPGRTRLTHYEEALERIFGSDSHPITWACVLARSCGPEWIQCHA